MIKRYKKTFLLLFQLLVAPLFFTGCSHAEETITPFISDGCSGFPDGTLQQQALWQRCCVIHDKSYWMGGSYEQRLAADEALKVCVEEVGEAEIAQLMLAGVRVGGTPYLPTSFRWGYGWPYPRGYKSLTDKQSKLLLEILKNN